MADPRPPRSGRLARAALVQLWPVEPNAVSGHAGVRLANGRMDRSYHLWRKCRLSAAAGQPVEERTVDCSDDRRFERRPLSSRPRVERLTMDHNLDPAILVATGCGVIRSDRPVFAITGCHGRAGRYTVGDQYIAHYLSAPLGYRPAFEVAAPVIAVAFHSHAE